MTLSAPGASPVEKSSRSLALTLMLCVVLASCGRIQAARISNNPNVRLSLLGEPADALEKQTSTLLITLMGADGQPIDGARVEVEGDMTHAGMTPVFATAAGSGGGRYTASMTWTMAGDWLVNVKATLPAGGTAERAFPLRVGAARP